MTAKIAAGKHSGQLQYGHGDPCSSCGKSDMECWRRIRRDGFACCSRCFSTDTHNIDTLNEEIRRAKEMETL
jgi:hypothetical protein